MNNLKHCPFCGSSKVSLESSAMVGPDESVDGFIYYVMCISECLFPGPISELESEAIEKWNTRFSVAQES